MLHTSFEQDEFDGDLMSDHPRHGEAGAVEPTSEPQRSTRRITFDLLDEYTIDADARGYDPYNANTARRPVDAWKGKPKRA